MLKLIARGGIAVILINEWPQGPVLVGVALLLVLVWADCRGYFNDASGED